MTNRWSISQWDTPPAPLLEFTGVVNSFSSVLVPEPSTLVLLLAALPLAYPAYRLFLSAACLVLAGGMYLVIQRTRLGMAIRAGSANREMVQLLGIDVGRLFQLVFAAGVALAAFAGMIASPIASVYPGMGNQILIVCFVVVVIGGIGSIKGAFLASLLIGLADTFGQILMPQTAGMTIYMLMAAVLLWRPAGLFGRS